MTTRIELGSVSLLFLVSLIRCQAGTEVQCPSPHTAGITVSLKNRLNATGHWISQMTLAEEEASLSLSKWQVDINYQKSSCNRNQATRNYVITVTESPPKAGPDYELFPGLGYYKFHPLITNMAQARKVCADEGAHLIIVNSEAEADVTKTLYARYPNVTNGYAWVGVLEKGINEYVTIFGDSFKSTGFTRWDKEEPNSDGPGDCIVISKVDGGLHDTTCAGGFPAVCEQDI